MVKKFSSLLVRDDVVSIEKMEEALQRQVVFGGRLGTNLLEMGVLSEEELWLYLAQVRHLPAATLDHFLDVEPNAIALLDLKTVELIGAIPVSIEADGTVTCLVLDKHGPEGLEELRHSIGHEPTVYIVPEFRFEGALSKFYDKKLSGRMERLCERFPIEMTLATPSIGGPKTVKLGKPDLRDEETQKVGLGVDWTPEEVFDFLEGCYVRDVILAVLMGFTARFASRRMLLVVLKHRLQGYTAAGTDVDGDRLRKVRLRIRPKGAIERVCSGDTFYQGPPADGELMAIYDAVSTKAPSNCLLLPVPVGPRAAMALLFDDSERTFETDELTALFEVVNAISSALERLIQLTKSDKLPPEKLRIPSLPERLRRVWQTSIEAAQREAAEALDEDSSEMTTTQAIDTTVLRALVSSDEVPADEVPADEVPADEVPADEVPADEVPAEEVPAEEVPADEPQPEDAVAPLNQDTPPSESEVSSLRQDPGEAKERSDQVGAEAFAADIGAPIDPAPLLSSDILESTEIPPEAPTSALVENESVEDTEHVLEKSSNKATASLTEVPKLDSASDSKISTRFLDADSSDMSDDIIADGWELPDLFLEGLENPDLDILEGDAEAVADSIDLVFDDDESLDAPAKLRNEGQLPAEREDFVNPQTYEPTLKIEPEEFDDEEDGKTLVFDFKPSDHALKDRIAKRDSESKAKAIDKSTQPSHPEVEASEANDDLVANAVDLSLYSHLFEDDSLDQIELPDSPSGVETIHPESTIGLIDVRDIELEVIRESDPELFARISGNDLDPATARALKDWRPFVDLLTDSDKEQKLIGRKALLNSGGQALPALLERFPGKLLFDRYAYSTPKLPTVSKHSALLDILVEMGDLAAPAVASFFDIASAEVRFYATFFFSRVRYEPIVSQMGKQLFDKERMTREIARQVLRSYRSTDAFSAVLENIRSAVINGDSFIKEQGIIAAEALADVQTIPLLIDTIDHSNSHLAKVALRALNTLTFEDFGQNKRKWNKWWTKHRSESRQKWLVEALNHNLREVRATAARELAHYPLTINFSPDSSRRERARAQKILSQFFKDTNNRG